MGKMTVDMNTKTQEQTQAIASQIETVDGLIGEMVDCAANSEISWSVLVSRLLTHGIVGLHQLLVEQDADITEKDIHEEIIQSTNLIHQLYVAQGEMQSPRILH